MNKKFLVAEKSETIDAEYSIVGWGSKPVPDRDGELIESSAWKLDNYRKNPVLMLCHDYSSPPVGKVLWIKSDANGLKFKAKFANTDRGKEIYQLYKEGIMSAFSVGFSPNPNGSVKNPTEPKYKGLKTVYKDVELLEISCVPIPANYASLVEYVKSGKIQTKQLKEEMDAVIEIITKAEIVTNPEIEGEDKIVIKSDDQEVKVVLDEKEDVQDKAIDEKAVDEKAVDEKKDNAESGDEKKCPGGGTFGSDNGEFDECKECSLAEECKTGSSKKKEEKELESFINDLPSISERICKYYEYPTAKEPIANTFAGYDLAMVPIGKRYDVSGAPSIYDIMDAINRNLNPAAMEPNRPTSTIVDLYPIDFPNGYVVFSERDTYQAPLRYKRVMYTYSFDTKECTLTDASQEVSESWVVDRYGMDEFTIKDEKPDIKDIKEDDKEDLIEKAGRVLSGKNRNLISECVDSMTKSISSLNDLLTATDSSISDAVTKEEGEIIKKEEDDELEVVQKSELDDELEVIQKDPKDPDEDVVIEIEKKEVKEPENIIEIDEDVLRETLKKTIQDVIGGNVRDAVGTAFKRIQGKVS
jgi:HK97 family phage prohead protease